MSTATVRLNFPWDGDVLNRHDGIERADRLEIVVTGQAWPGAKVTCRGQETVTDGDGNFALPVSVTQREETIEVVASDGAATAAARARVMWDDHSRPRYRFSVDDNIEFLADLARDPDAYPSIFDHWYLAFWRDLHREYGTKIHINIYYTDGRGFTLDQMPDRWRDEWQANSDWLHLTFHARQDKPDRIYKEATYEEIARDAAMVREQIVRFAGPEVLSPVTTLHWAECPAEGVRALYDDGYRGLIILAEEPAESCTTRYYLSPELTRHIAGRDAWKDFDMDMLFIECDMVVNLHTPEAIPPLLQAQVDNPHTGELMELLIHEQYFRRELPIYLPDARERARTAIEFVASRGYEPVFWGEEFFA